MVEIPNLNYVDGLSKGDRSFTKKIISIVARELPVEIKTYQLELEKKDYSKTADTVHKLKHKIRILGLEKSYGIAEEYELNLRKGNLDLKSVFEETLETMLFFVRKKNQEL
ncbi:Hpt domain-containing protein [uncultured Kriegella sp.]|uniref:Hpt domain-containing protein n=1 Tax=uncultured Kriegella sp. TaxID=1798910 RepID=UPI0030D841F6|tara:strand:- start:1444 stop:1776 length:333 start_codon:yes stop_codon:yes gene_type:complete